MPGYQTPPPAYQVQPPAYQVPPPQPGYPPPQAQQWPPNQAPYGAPPPGQWPDASPQPPKKGGSKGVVIAIVIAVVVLLAAAAVWFFVWGPGKSDGDSKATATPTTATQTAEPTPTATTDEETVWFGSEELGWLEAPYSWNDYRDSTLPSYMIQAGRTDGTITILMMNYDVRFTYLEGVDAFAESATEFCDSGTTTTTEATMAGFDVTHSDCTVDGQIELHWVVIDVYDEARFITVEGPIGQVDQGLSMLATYSETIE